MNSKLLITIALSIFLLGCGGSGGGDVAGATRPPVTAAPPAGQIGDGRLNEILEWARAIDDVPAMSMVLVQGGQIAEFGAVGKRSATANALATENDRWHLGSLTKAITATLAGVLVEQSVIDWQTRPLDVWPELDQSIHSGFRDITLKHLLSHTSGMTRPDTFPQSIDDDAPGSEADKRRAWAAELLSQTPVGTFGQFRYSNAGYVVAGAMLETITGTPWETLVSQQLFAPLGMIESGFGAPGDAAMMDQPWGHWDRDNHFEPVAPGPGADNPRAVGPAGTVHATLYDYAQFMIAHIAGARGIPGIVTVPTFNVLHTTIDEGSALGWGYDPDEDWAEGPVLAHAGSNVRWLAVVRLAPQLDAGVLIAINAGGDRADTTIDFLGDVILERFQASR